MPARITFSIEEALAEEVERIAKAERRSVSSYIALLIEADLRERTTQPQEAPTP
jgi:metal-responsive CopG/Arc/MetJ family transcriptional regulator